MTQIGAEWITTRAGGLNRYAEGLASALAAHGVSQRWLVVADRDERPAAGVAVTAVARPGDGLLTRWRALRRGYAEAASAAAGGSGVGSVVATHFALYAFPLRRQLRKVPHVVHFHGPWADESAAERAGRVAVAAKRILERSVYRTGDRFIVLSEAFKAVLVERYAVDAAKVRVIPGGVDVERFAPMRSRTEARHALGLPTERRIVFCVRRLVRRMGHEPLLDAMERLRSEHPNVLLLLAGKGPLESELRASIDRRGLSGDVRMVGFVSDEALPLWYRAADLSVVPTQSLEGFGLIVAESLAAGTPCVVTPVGGLPEVVAELEGGRGLVTADASGEAIAARLAEMLIPGRAPSEAACVAYARQRFAWPVVAGRVLEVYREAAGMV